MTLLELCDPLFQYVCRLNRSARKGVRIDVGTVRSEVIALLAKMRSDAGAQGLSEQYEKVRLPLVYFVDFMVKESKLDFARDFKELAHDENMLAGDEHFFDLLEETMADSSQNATERLAVFYVCIGLGFTGVYVGQPEYLRQRMKALAARLSGMMELSDSARLCPEAYEHVDKRNLVQPPGRSLMAIVVVLIALIVALIAGNVVLYRQSSSTLNRAFTDIAPQAKAPQPKAGE